MVEILEGTVGHWCIFIQQGTCRNDKVSCEEPYLVCKTQERELVTRKSTG
jgi:hypothetical protein